MVLDYPLQVKLNGLCYIEPRFEFQVQVAHIDGRDVDLLSNLFESLIGILSKKSALGIGSGELLTILNPLAKVPDFVSKVNFGTSGCLEDLFNLCLRRFASESIADIKSLLLRFLQISASKTFHDATLAGNKIDALPCLVHLPKNPLVERMILDVFQDLRLLSKWYRIHLVIHLFNLSVPCPNRQLFSLRL